MRRLRETDGSPSHRRHGRYHMAQCRDVGPTHNQLRGEMSPLFTGLKAAAQACADAEDAAVDTMADLDRAEVRIENAIRDIDAEAEKLDRSDATLNARKAVFPQGFGAEIDPEGEAQLGVLPALRVRLAPFAAKGGMPAAIAELDLAEAGLRAAVLADAGAEEEVERRFAEELAARSAIRVQLESAYGRLKDVYKARLALAERFFLNEGSRKPKKAKPPGTPAPEAASKATEKGEEKKPA